MAVAVAVAVATALAAEMTMAMAAETAATVVEIWRKEVLLSKMAEPTKSGVKRAAYGAL